MTGILACALLDAAMLLERWSDGRAGSPAAAALHHSLGGGAGGEGGEGGQRERDPGTVTTVAQAGCPAVRSERDA